MKRPNPYTAENSCILLTASIDPCGMSHTALLNPEERIEQYKRALDHYLARTPYRIVFCENTLYPFPAELYEHFCSCGRLEIIQFSGNHFENSLGKGYGEALIIDHALRNSRILQDPEIKCIIKITGRLIIENLDQLARCGTAPAGITADIHRLTKCGSQCVFAPVEFWKNFFCPERERLDDSKHFYFEHLLAEKIFEARKSFSVHPFAWELKINGVSGTSGKSYTTGCAAAFRPFRAAKILFLLNFIWPFTACKKFSKIRKG